MCVDCARKYAVSLIEEKVSAPPGSECFCKHLGQRFPKMSLEMVENLDNLEVVSPSHFLALSFPSMLRQELGLSSRSPVSGAGVHFH